MMDQIKKVLLLLVTQMQIGEAIPIAENRNPAMHLSYVEVFYVGRERSHLLLLSPPKKQST